MYLINYFRLLKRYLIFCTGLFYSTYSLATTSEEWIDGLKTAENNNNTAAYFIDTPPPEGLVVIHSWDISPFKEVDRPVGHMSIQTANWYLSVWPEEGTKIAINQDREEDFKEKGYTNFLILKVEEDDFYTLEDSIEVFILKIEDGNKIFSLGQSSLSVKVRDETLKVSLDGKEDIEGEMRFFIWKIMILNNSIPRQKSFLFKMFNIMYIEYHLPKQLLFLAYESFVYGGKVLSNDQINLSLTYKNSKEGHNSCVTSVFSCLKNIENLHETCEKINSQHQYLSFDFDVRSIVHFRKYLFTFDEDALFQAMLAGTELDVCRRNAVDISNFTSCLNYHGKDLDHNFSELIDIIKKELLENNSDISATIKEIKNSFEINYGRLNSLFPDPNILPGGSLKYLAYNIFEHKNDMYQYSSYEKTFGRPVGNLVRFKNLNSGKYLYPKKGSFELGTPLTQLNYQEAEKNIFRLIPSGEDDTFFIVSEYEKKSFDVKSGLDVNGTPLTLWNPHFSDNQRFRFVKEYSSTTNEAVVRIVSTKTNKSLDVQFNSKSNNAVVHFWGWNDVDSQLWIIETVEEDL